jgi:UDP-glucuronate decarboxylase
MSQASAKSILITGGAGFIGSHLCEALLDRGHRVIALDNMLTGSEANVAHLRGHPDFRLFRHDVIEPLPRHIMVDEIYNLACAASPPRYQADPVHTMQTSVYGAVNLLDAARRTGARILQASTSEVYGDPEIHPQPETYWGHVNPTGPRACYDEGKRAAETLFFDYHRRWGVPIRVARIFNTYGPRMQRDDGRVVSNFIVQALQGQPLTVYGDGSQTRSLCYVDDLVRGLMTLMEGDDRNAVPVNLGNPHEVTVLEIAERVLALTGSDSSIEHRPLPVDDPRRRQPVIDRARHLLGWEPRVDLADGLQRTVTWFKRTLWLANARPKAANPQGRSEPASFEVMSLH